jgi:vacuolar-type H+-ATPase subunit E/Vma4
MSERFFRNPSFLDYVRLLYQLHRAIKEGWDETAEGEALRERMDELGRGLSREEITSLNGISANFYGDVIGENQEGQTRLESLSP